jgi:rubrerythrin
MNKTENDLKSAFAGESQAHTKYWIYAERAEKENLPNIARLFRAISYAERIHATSHFKTLGLIGKTSENLQDAIDGETYEVNEMYPAFIKDAIEEAQKQAERSEQWALESEKKHITLYADAKSAVDAGKDADIAQISVCEICGYTVEGEAPDNCPVCNAKKEKFRKF